MFNPCYLTLLLRAQAQDMPGLLQQQAELQAQLEATRSQLNAVRDAMGATPDLVRRRCCPGLVRSARDLDRASCVYCMQGVCDHGS